MLPMLVRIVFSPWLPVLLLLGLFLVACGDGDEGETFVPGGALTDPGSVPVATPWPEPPEPIFLEEGAIAPLTGEEEGEEVAAGETYVVQPGDTAWAIAQRFNITLEELAEANDTTIDDLRTLSVGEELIIPGPSQ